MTRIKTEELDQLQFGKELHKRPSRLAARPEFIRHRSKTQSMSKPPVCEGCGKNPSDPPSPLCVGCQAYKEHQQ